MLDNNDEFVKTFAEGAVKVAEFMDWLDGYKGHLEVISNITKDNADPECNAADALEKLGMLLSTLVIYKDEYEKDPWKPKNDNQ